MKRNLLLFFSLLLAVSSFGQERDISGMVKSAEGESIPGANVIVQGTTIGTISDQNGQFKLSVPQDAEKLIISFIGFAPKEIAIENKSFFDVILEADFLELDPVVVVGYGTQKRSDITGSVATFNTNNLKERPQTNIALALQGTIAGVQVSTSSSRANDGAHILIRGKNSISASNSPLIIVNGVPGGLGGNPNDIESIEILKDASATAIYGARGANGVILVTTKQGKEGKLKVSYNGYYSYDVIAHLPDMQNASDFWRDSWERGITNSLSQPTNTNSLQQQIDLTFDGTENDNTDLAAFMMGYPGQTWEDIKNQILSKYPEYVHDYETLKQIGDDFAYPAGGRNTDWLALATQIGHKQQHSLSLTGGNQNYQYYISSFYHKVDGIAVGDMFQKVNLRMNFKLRLMEGVYYGTNTGFSSNDQSGIPARWGGITGPAGALLISPTYNALNEDGSIDLHPVNENTLVTNPLEPLLFDNTNKGGGFSTRNYLDVDIPWISGLHYKLNTAYSRSNSHEGTYKGRNTVEGAMQNGILNRRDGFGQSWLIDNILSYNKTLGKHNIFLTALYSAQEDYSEATQINGKGFATDIMSYYQASKADILTAFSDYTRSSHLSQMFRANYGFDKRYLATATIRRDGYSAFGTTKKFGIFPSFAVGWNIANENFMAAFRKNLDELKLRLSYGKNGNEAIKPYSTLPVLSSVDYIDQNMNVAYGYFPQSLENSNLGWETTKSFNLGLDFTLFKGRVRGAFDTYRSNTFDLLLRETISSINGTNSIIRNIGETKNNGLEIQLSTVNVSRNKFFWKTDFNFATYNSVIVNVGIKDADGNYIDDVASHWFIGYPIDVNFDYSLDRILQKEDFILDANGNYVLDANNNYQLKEEIRDQIVVFGTPFPGKPVVKDINGDGIIGGSEDKELHGDLAPDFLAGMTNTIKYGNWTFSFFLNGLWGVTKQNNLINTKGLGPKRKMNLTYWTPDNPINGFPGINAGSLTVTDIYPYFDASFIRLQDVSLSYDFPSELLSRLSISDLTAYINIKNLTTFTNWNGLDPEYTTQSDVPRARVFLLGLRFSF